MAKLNLYEQQTSFQAPRADAQTFGAGVAQAAGRLGEVGFDLGVQMKRREDVIDRVQRLTDFDLTAQQGLQAVVDTDDIAKKSTVDGYAQGLRQQADQILSQHGGTAASRAELKAQLDNQVGQYVKSAVGAQVKAQQQFIGRRVEQNVNRAAIQGAMAPQMMPQLFEQLDADLAQYADALSPEQAAAYREAGRSQIAQGSIDRMLTDGNWQGAKALMSNPEIGQYLNPAAARKFGIDIAVDERKAEVEVQRQERNVRNLTSLARRNLTPEEVIRARSLPEKKNMTVSDKIAEYEIVTGRPAPQSVINEMFDVENGRGPGGAFGNSMEGRAWSFVTDNAPAYAAGLLSPEQRRQYDASLAIVGKPTTRINPLTQQMETISPELPSWVRQAVQQGQSYSAPGAGGGAAPGQRVRLTDAAGQPVGEAVVGADGTWTMQGRPGAAWSGERDIPQAGAPAATSTPSNQQGIPATPQTRGDSGRTVWERRESIAGPVAAASSAVNSIPGVGPAIAGTLMGEEQVRQIDADRTFVENASRDMVRVVQNSPQFAEGERKAIAEELTIGPEVFRSKESYEAKLIGISQSMTRRKLEAQQALASNISGEERKKSMDKIVMIDNFMQALGVPPVVATEQEVQMLAPGTVFMDAKGNEFRKR